jgi:predicted Zn-dependent protease
MRTLPQSRHPWTRGLVALLVVSIAAGPVGCFSPTKVPPIGAEGAFSLERDEARLWDQARDEERQLRTKAAIHRDPILEDYLNQVAQKLVPPQAAAQEVLKIRVHAIKDPSLNAFTYPTGSIYIHTGLLARLEDEAQLATVIGHEIAHATERHALEYNRSARNKMIGFSIAAIAASVLIAGEAGEAAGEGDWKEAYVINQVGNILVGLGLQLGFLAAVNGFGRDLEREADVVGLDRLVAAGYDPRRAPRVFELLKDDHGDPSKAEVFFFGSHPRLQERIESANEILATRYPGLGAEGRVVDTRDFQMRTRVLVREDALQNLEAGRLSLAQDEITRVLKLTPKDGVAHYVQGQIHERRASETKDRAEARRLEDQALARYDEAIRIDPRQADPHRARGILLYRRGDRAAALPAFRRYLDLRPDAPDAQQVRDYILEIEAS